MISWNGRIVALSYIAANTWSHEMVPCPFFCRPRKKQLRACCVFRKNAIVVKGSFLRAAKSRMSQVEQWENVNFCQILGHILPTHLISQHVISFLSPLERKATWASISVGRGDRKSSLPQRKQYGTFLQIFFSSVSSSYTNVGRLA
jgi:hypothetical protein